MVHSAHTFTAAKFLFGWKQWKHCVWNFLIGSKVCMVWMIWRMLMKSLLLKATGRLGWLFTCKGDAMWCINEMVETYTTFSASKDWMWNQSLLNSFKSLPHDATWSLSSGHVHLKSQTLLAVVLPGTCDILYFLGGAGEVWRDYCIYDWNGSFSTQTKAWLGSRYS